jgi:selenide,water dikinase
LFYDAQTSGGMLISAPAARAEALVADLKRRGAVAAMIIGSVVARDRPAIILRD